MTNSAWHWKRRAANGWSSTTPRTRKARTPRAKRVGGADDGRQGKAAATAPTWEGSPEGDAADAQSTYNRRTTEVQRNNNGNTTELQRAIWLVAGYSRAVFPLVPTPTFASDGRVLPGAHQRSRVNTTLARATP